METPLSETSAVLLAHFRNQGKACALLGSPFMEALCEAFGEDFEAGGPVHALLHDWPTDPTKDALALRLAGALHHATLNDAPPDLARKYPARAPRWSMDNIWPEARAYLVENLETVRAFLKSAPQTNETRRSIALLPGFLQLAAAHPGKPIHLLELGASAGLNQNWDRFSYKTQSWEWTGGSDVLIQTDWQTEPPAHLDASFNIASRSACDLNPLNLTDSAQTMLLRCYIWPDQTERLSRFDAAVKLAIETQTQVHKADAAQWLKASLSSRPDNALTIVYHSIFLQYPPRLVIADIFDLIERAGEKASEDAPLAWLCFEPEGLFDGSGTAPSMITRLQTWPGGEARILNRSDGHATRVTPA